MVQHQPRATLYKYFPPERIDVMENRLLRFTRPTEFNDTFDTHFLVPKNDSKQGVTPDSRVRIEYLAHFFALLSVCDGRCFFRSDCFLHNRPNLRTWIRFPSPAPSRPRQIGGFGYNRARDEPAAHGRDERLGVIVMPLLSFWKSNREDVLTLNIEQILSNAGDGNLRDTNLCSQELRQFFQACPSDCLFKYARHCLEASFEKSGLVLQDIVNELGRRLDFDVENGLYQGKSTSIGFDGIWRVKDEPPLIIEVKTTDYVTISLDKLITYKEKLIANDRVSRVSSVLIIVGREDTGALEAQVRGSRYAWEMRLISIEGLIKLVQIKEKSDDPVSLLQIRQLLQPFEYTKIDKIIDVIFTTAADVESQQTTEQEAPADEGAYRQGRTEPELINAKRQQAVEAFAILKGKALIKRSRTLYWNPEKDFRVCCAVSKKYEKDYQPYWYAYYPKWDDFLGAGQESYFILSCMDRDEAFALPYSWLLKNKKNLNMTEKDGRSYWHVALTTLEGDALGINVSKAGGKTSLDPYRFTFSTR